MILGECESNHMITAFGCNRLSADKFNIRFKLKDGTVEELTFENYIRFIALYGSLPSECSLEDYNEYKMMCEL